MVESADFHRKLNIVVFHKIHYQNISIGIVIFSKMRTNLPSVNFYWRPFIVLQISNLPSAKVIFAKLAILL